MSKQYTFKTTRDTEWLESIIDGLPSADRSRTIRMALTIYFDDMRPAVTHRVTPMTHKVTPPVQPSVTESHTEKPVIKIDKNGKSVVPMVSALVIEAQDEDLDLDSKLNNLFD